MAIIYYGKLLFFSNYGGQPDLEEVTETGENCIRSTDGTTRHCNAGRSKQGPLPDP